MTDPKGRSPFLGFYLWPKQAIIPASQTAAAPRGSESKEIVSQGSRSPVCRRVPL